VLLLKLELYLNSKKLLYFKLESDEILNSRYMMRRFFKYILGFSITINIEFLGFLQNVQIRHYFLKIHLQISFFEPYRQIKANLTEMVRRWSRFKYFNILSPVIIKNNLISVYLSSNWKALRPISFLPCNHAFSFNQKDNKMWPD